jgi:hypothetical protein
MRLSPHVSPEGEPAKVLRDCTGRKLQKGVALFWNNLSPGVVLLKYG